MLGQFAKDRTTARQRYRKFVAEGLANPGNPWQKLTGQIFFGSEGFMSRMQEFLEERQDIKEIPHTQRDPGRPSLAQIFSQTAKADKKKRNHGAGVAHIRYGYTLKEIADYLGIHYTTVSRIVSESRGK